MPDALLPCPFCGGDRLALIVTYDAQGDVVVSCEVCLAVGPPVDDVDAANPNEAANQARANWNRRADQEPR